MQSYVDGVIEDDELIRLYDETFSKTKGSTAETFEDGSELSRFKSWSPKTYRKIAKTSESGAHSLEMVGNNVTDEDNDEFAVRFLYARTL